MESRLDSWANPWPVYVFAGLCLFSVVNYLTRFTVPRSVAESRRKNPAEATWKWRNIMTSFAHSSLTGIGSLWVFVAHPSLGADMINGFSPSAHALVSLSTGYFVYDFLDMAVNHMKGSSTYELLVHHVAVLLCFGMAITTRTYVPYATLALLIEINSVFLHARQLLNIAGVPKSSWQYRLNAGFNMTTFVLFRILLLGWMTRWMTLHRDDINLIAFTMGSVSLFVVVGLNILLLYRIIATDYLKPHQNTEEDGTGPDDVARALFKAEPVKKCD